MKSLLKKTVAAEYSSVQVLLDSVAPMPTLDFKLLFDLSPNPYVLLSPALDIVHANRAYLAVTGRTHEQLIGRNMFEAFPGDPNDAEAVNERDLRASFKRVLETRQRDTLALIRYAIPRQTAGGVVFDDRYWSATHTPLLDEQGEVALILQHTVDVTELHALQGALLAAEKAGYKATDADQMEAGLLSRAQQVQEANKHLDAQRQHLLQLFQQAPGFMCFLRGPNHIFELANEAYFKLVGHRPILGKSVREAFPDVAEQGYFQLLDDVFTSGQAFVGRGMKVSFQRAPGAPLEDRFVDLVYQPVIGPDGSIVGIFAQGHDITEQKRAEDELKAYRDRLEQLVQERTKALEESEAERQVAENALRQAQKMDAVGKLTGGVAHDFNNLLQVISSNLYLLKREVEHSDAAKKRLSAASRAVERGSKLASQLLAFARRQPLQPQVVNLGRLTRNIEDLLLRALGEHIELQILTEPGLWNTNVDPNNIENAILNLALNARDAMEDYGTLTLDIRNVQIDEYYAALHPDAAPGDYVLISVSDTGSGMTQEVMERAFEPFFTTKGEGQGTGLGLSMVYGFVKQSGGHIQLHSEVGQGTTINVFLPRAVQAEEILPETTTGPIEGGKEAILVVEDDEQVRTAVVDFLAELGYRVLKASDGASALAVLESGVAVDLLFTDVIMPGPVRSPDLARRAKALHPNIEVLFTSGYTEDAVSHGGRLDPGVSLLSKPYHQEDLARRVRHMLNNRAQRSRTHIDQASAPPTQPVPQGPLRILVVEDDEIIRLSTVELLRDLGHSVTPVGSAEKALTALAGQAFDMLITDVSLPGMSGVDLIRNTRGDYPNLDAVICSGFGNPLGESAIEGVRFLPKPFDVQDLERLLSTAERAA